MNTANSAAEWDAFRAWVAQHEIKPTDNRPCNCDDCRRRGEAGAQAETPKEKQTSPQDTLAKIGGAK